MVELNPYSQLRYKVQKHLAANGLKSRVLPQSADEPRNTVQYDNIYLRIGNSSVTTEPTGQLTIERIVVELEMSSKDLKGIEKLDSLMWRTIVALRSFDLDLPGFEPLFQASATRPAVRNDREGRDGSGLLVGTLSYGTEFQQELWDVEAIEMITWGDGLLLENQDAIAANALDATFNLEAKT